MAALAATRHNPALARVLRAPVRGRQAARRCALVACMRKLLTLLNAVLRHRTPVGRAAG